MFCQHDKNLFTPCFRRCHCSLLLLRVKGFLVITVLIRSLLRIFGDVTQNGTQAINVTKSNKIAQCNKNGTHYVTTDNMHRLFLHVLRFAQKDNMKLLFNYISYPEYCQYAHCVVKIFCGLSLNIFLPLKDRYSG